MLSTGPHRELQQDEHTIRGRALTVLSVTTLLTLVPLLIAAQFEPLRILEHAAFAVFMAACILFYTLVLARYSSTWVQALSMLGIWGLAVVFTALFSQELGNSYLSFIVAVQLVFALLGPRYGLAMMALSILTLVVETYMGGGREIERKAFMLAVLVAVGVLTWVFVYAGKVAGERALRLAHEATNAKDEAERLAHEVTRLNRMLLTSQDNERRRLARDIHDGPLQSLGVELLAIDRVRRRIQSGELDKAETELEYLRQLAAETVADLRGTVNALRNTLLDTGIEHVLQGLARKLQEQAGLAVQVSALVGDTLPRPLQNCIYQIVLEGVNNVKKHARARRLYIGLCHIGGKVELRVKDDGQGFRFEESLEQAIKRGHIGLHSMKERAAELGGTMQVISSSGRGAELIFSFPPTYSTNTLVNGVLDVVDTEPHAEKIVYMAGGIK